MGKEREITKKYGIGYRESGCQKVKERERERDHKRGREEWC